MWVSMTLACVGAADVESILSAYKNASTPQAKDAALQQILKNYDQFKHHVAQKLGTGTMTPEFSKLTREIDETIVDMTHQAWRDVVRSDPSGVTHVVPVGSLGNRFTTPGYIPGKSDKDMIPMGPRAAESVEKFQRAFTTRFGIAPERLDINVLDPTNPSGWPGRVEAAANPEKYNTLGGNNWLQRDTYTKNPTIWKLDPTTGKVQEAQFQSLFPKGAEPPPLTARDAAGYFSDNTRFRNELASKYSDPAELILKQSKYDLRNAAAYGLAGGKFTAEERALMEAAALARNGKLDEAIRRYATAIGADAGTEAGKQAAMKAYLDGMNSLTEKIGNKVVATHLDEIARAGKKSGALIAELGGVLNNLPPGIRQNVVKELSKDVSKANTLRLAEQVANTLAKDVFIKKAFDEAAQKLFGKPYEKLTPAEKLLVHNAGEESASALSTFGKGVGVTLTAAAILVSMQQAYASESATRGTAIGVGAGIGRGILDLIQLGYPPLVAAELAGRAAALGITAGIDSYKTDVLDKLYEQYKRTGNIDDVLNDAEFQKYFPGGLRVFRNELREAAAREGKNLTEAQLDQAIRDYFINRQEIEKQTKKIERDLEWAKAFVNSRHIPLVPGADSDTANSRLSEQELEQALAGLLLAKMNFEQMLRSAGVPFTKQDILNLLFLYYRGTPDQLTEALNKLYRNVGKTYPPSPKTSRKPKTTTQLSDGKTSAPGTTNKSAVKILHSKYGTVARGPQSQGNCSPGVLLSGGGSFHEKPVDAPCDPPISLGSTEVSCGGELSVVVDVDKQVPLTWSLHNNNTAVSVFYEPRISGKLGRREGLGVACGGPPDGDCSITLTLPGPGKLSAQADAPRGAGPLSGSCFQQSFQARVALTKAFNVVPADQQTELHPGDRLRTEPHSGSRVVLATSQGERLVIGKGENEVRLTKTSSGEEQLVVEKGGYGSTLRYTRPQNPQAGERTKSLSIRDGGYTLRPNGTDFLVTHLGETTTVAVLEGRVEVRADDQFTTTVEAGMGLDLKQRRTNSLTDEARDALTLDGLSPDEILLQPENQPELNVGACFSDGKILPDWFVLDQGADTKITSGDTSDTLFFVVPPGNELNRREVTLPLLLHAVTGDFDLEGTVDVTTTATDNAMALLMVHQPGGYLGFHEQEREKETYAAHFLSFGGLQLVNNRWELTSLEGEGKRPNFETSPTAVRLRLTRRGNVWKSFASVDDGVTWHLTKRMVVDANATVYAGWGFQRAAYDSLAGVPATFELRDVRLTGSPSQNLPVKEWESNALAGEASATEEGLVATVVTDQPGAARVESAYPLTGDFDLVAEYEILAWRNARYETSSFCFYVCDISYQNFAYVGRIGVLNEQERLHTDLRQDGGWNRGYQWVENADRTGKIRIRRVGNEISSYFWDLDHWERLDKGFRGGWDSPAYMGLMVSNESEGGLPANASVRIRLLETQQKEVVAESSAPSPDEIQLEPIPSLKISEIQTPDNWDVAAIDLPFDIGAMFPAKEAGAYVFSSDRKLARLAKVTQSLQITDVWTTDLLAGVNRKAGLERPESFWIIVDGWWEGGNRHSGLYKMDRDGRWISQVDAVALGDLSAVMGIGDNRLFLADFARGGIYEYQPPVNKLETLVEGADDLRGVVSLALDSSRNILLATTAKSYGAPQSGLCRMDLRQRPLQPRKIFVAGRETEDFTGVVWDKTTPDPDDVLVAVTAQNSIWRVNLNSGKAEVVVRGMPTIAALRWSGDTLWALCTPRTVVQFRPSIPAGAGATQSPSQASMQPQMTPDLPRRDGSRERTPVSVPTPLPTRQTTGGPSSPLESPAPPSSGEPKRFVFRSPQDSVRLLDSYPTSDIVLMFTLSWTKAGSIFDTIGIDAAPTGSWTIQVEPTGHLTFSVYSPKVASSVRISNGWHVLRSSTPLPKQTPVIVRIIHVPSGSTQILFDDEVVAEANIPVSLSGESVYLGDYPPDKHWSPRYQTDRGFVGWLEIHQMGKYTQQIKTPEIKLTPYAEPVGSMGKKQIPPPKENGLQAFAGRWEIIQEEPTRDEKEFIVLRLVDGKIVGKGGRNEDLLEFDEFVRGDLKGRVVPREGTSPLPVTASVQKNGTELVLKIAPPASEFVIVRAKKVRTNDAGAQQVNELRKRLEEARELYRLAIEKGSDEDIKEAQRAVKEIESELQRVHE